MSDGNMEHSRGCFCFLSMPDYSEINCLLCVWQKILQPAKGMHSAKKKVKKKKQTNFQVNYYCR